MFLFLVLLLLLQQLLLLLLISLFIPFFFLFEKIHSYLLVQRMQLIVCTGRTVVLSSAIAAIHMRESIIDVIVWLFANIVLLIPGLLSVNTDSDTFSFQIRLTVAKSGVMCIHFLQHSSSYFKYIQILFFFLSFCNDQSMCSILSYTYVRSPNRYMCFKSFLYTLN